MTEEQSRRRFDELLGKLLLQIWRDHEATAAKWSEDARNRFLGDLLMGMGAIRSDLEQKAVEFACEDGWRIDGAAFDAADFAALAVKGEA